MEKETYLTFTLGGEFFAVNVANVLEVLEKQQITHIPNAPDHILGIINFRGAVVPVVNTYKKLNLSIIDENEMEYILIIFEIGNNEDKFTIAATADAVRNVIEISPDEIKPIPEMGISLNSQFVQGTVKHDDIFILLLQTEKVFSVSDSELVEK